MVLTDISGVIIRKNGSVDIGDQKVSNVGMLGRLGKKFLKLEFIPAHPHACSCSRLKRPDQGRTFLQQKSCAVLILAVYVLYGYKRENRK